MSLSRTVAVLSSAVVVAGQTLSWVGGNATNMCLGNYNTDFVTALVGLKGSSACSGTTGPAEYISFSLYSFGGISDVISYSNPDGSVDPTKVLQASLASPPMTPTAVDSVTTVPGAEYAYRGIGSYVNAVPTASSTAWYWVGAAVYFLKYGTIATNTNSFRYQAYMNNAYLTNQQIDCCIATDSGTRGLTCGAPQTYQPGSVKFSLYGYSAGPQSCKAYVNNGTVQANNSFFRLLVNITAMGGGKVSSVAFNNAYTLSTIGTNSVANITVDGANTSLSMSFPQKAVYGSLQSFLTSGTLSNYAVQPITIRAWPNGADTKSFFLDFIFNFTDDINKCQGFFVYDPAVQMATKSAASALAATTTAGATVGTTVPAGSATAAPTKVSSTSRPVLFPSLIMLAAAAGLRN